MLKKKKLGERMSLLIKASEVSSLFDSLATNGVEIVFSSNEEELLDCAKHSSLRFFQLKHEQGAVHAANGYARVTGKPGVVLLTTAAGSRKWNYGDGNSLWRFRSTRGHCRPAR